MYLIEEHLRQNLLHACGSHLTLQEAVPKVIDSSITHAHKLEWRIEQSAHSHSERTSPVDFEVFFIYP